MKNQTERGGPGSGLEKDSLRRLGLALWEWVQAVSLLLLVVLLLPTALYVVFDDGAHWITERGYPGANAPTLAAGVVLLLGLAALLRWRTWIFPMYRRLALFDSEYAPVAAGLFILLGLSAFVVVAHSVVEGGGVHSLRDWPILVSRTMEILSSGAEATAADPNPGRLIQAARLWTPIFLLLPLLLAGLRFFLANIPGWLMRRLSRHAVVVGLGPMGRQACRDFLARRDRGGELGGVVAVDPASLPGNRAFCEEAGILYLPSPGPLLKALEENASLARADWLALVDEQDDTNLNLFLEFRDWMQAGALRRDPPIRTLLHLGAQEVMRTLHGHPRMKDKMLKELGIRLYPFNANRNAAADLFSELLVPDRVPWISLRDGEPVLRVFILGYGQNGAAFVELLLQLAHPASGLEQPDPLRLEIHIFDKQLPGTGGEPAYALGLHLKNITDVATVQPHRLDVRDAAAITLIREAATRPGGRCVFLVSLGDEMQSVSAAIRIQREIPDQDQREETHFFVRTPRLAGLDKLLEEDVAQFPNLHPFGSVDETCSLDDILRENLERKTLAAGRAYAAATAWYAHFRNHPAPPLPEDTRPEATLSLQKAANVFGLVRDMKDEDPVNWDNDILAALHFNLKLAWVGAKDIRAAAGQVPADPPGRASSLDELVENHLRPLAGQLLAEVDGQPAVARGIAAWADAGIDSNPDPRVSDALAGVRALVSHYLKLEPLFRAEEARGVPAGLTETEKDALRTRLELGRKRERELREFITLLLLLRDWRAMEPFFVGANLAVHDRLASRRDGKPPPASLRAATFETLDAADAAFTLPPDNLLEKLARFEHARWWTEKTLQGDLDHACLKPSEELPPVMRHLDHIQIAALAAYELLARLNAMQPQRTAGIPAR